MGRFIKRLNQDWYFKLGNVDINDTNFNVTQCEKVCLPHSVSLTPAISSGCINYQGLCYYRKELYVSNENKNKQISLEFDGAMGVTELYVNKKLVKTHYCGYTPLVADISHLINFDKINIIELKLDNSDNEDVPPGKAQHMLDFTYDGGLYREARIVFNEKLYITNALLANQVAGGGVFVSYKNVSENSAIVHVQTHINNETDLDKTFNIVNKIIDKDNNCVSKKIVNASLNNKTHNNYQCDITVDTPNLWSPETPYMYQLLTIIEENGVEIDQVTTNIGIRTFKFTHDNGLIFNGISRKISGANYHHTHVYIGNAMPENLLRRDALKLRDAGFKSIRSHYPLTPAFVDACNEYGLTLLVSAPGWQWFKEGIFVERAKENVRNMVRWQRNNPCIIIWEPILNESYMPEEFRQVVYNIVHEEYPYEDCYVGSDSSPNDIIYKNFDVGMLDPEIAEYYISEESSKPIWVREYNDRPDDWSNQSCAWRSPRSFGEQAMLRAVDRSLGLDPQCRLQNYIDMVNDNTICGYGVWPGIEHNRGYQTTPCWGGTLDLFRVPKFTYHFYKSQQDIEEVGVVLFIANFWTELSSNDVTVYSNAERLRLYYNDEFVEEISPDNIKVNHPPFTFKNVRNRYKDRERSVIKVEALVNGEVVAQETRRSPGVQRSLKLEADFMDIPLKADGADIVMVYCKVVDDYGNIIPMTADKYPIKFTIEGEGEIIGDETIGANPICPEGGIAAIMVRSTKTPGEIKVKAEMYWKQSSLNAVTGHEIIFSSIESN